MLQKIGAQFAMPQGMLGNMATWIMNRMNHAMYEKVEAHLVKTHPQAVLEIGFGNGYLLKKACQKYTGTYYAVELSEDMLKRCKQDPSLKDVSLYKGRAETLPFPNSAFDCMYSINTIYFWESLEAGFQEIRRCMKPQGYCVITFYTSAWMKRRGSISEGYHLYTREEVESAMEACGLRVKDVSSIGRRQGYCIVTQVC